MIWSVEWRMVKSISLILFMLALLAVAMTNYSLSLYLSLALTLPAVLAQPWTPAPGYVQSSFYECVRRQDKIHPF